jgi:hypothetical protein
MWLWILDAVGCSFALLRRVCWPTLEECYVWPLVEWRKDFGNLIGKEQEQKFVCCALEIFLKMGIRSRGGHSLMIFKTMCVQTLLPLCYMLRIIQNFIIFFVKL